MSSTNAVRVVTDRSVGVVGGIRVDASGAPLLKGKEWKQKFLRGGTVRSANQDLPIHAKNVPPMDLCGFEKRLNTEERKVWTDLHRYLSDEMYLALAASRGRVRKNPVKALSDKDIEKLLAAGVAEHATDHHGVLVFGGAFSVDELMKLRRRAINHPGQMNDGLEIPSMELPRLEDIRNTCAGHGYAWTCDASAWYHQIELKFTVRRFFAFYDSNGTCYVLKRMPMGASFSCAVGHFITSCVARMARGKCEVLTYIDNYAFVGSEADVKAARDNMWRISRELGITIEETTDSPTSSFSFIGYDIDLKNRTVANSKNTIAKCLEHPIDACETRREILAVYGRYFNCLRLYPWIHAHLFYVLKFHRRVSARAQRDGLDGHQRVWPCLLDKFEFMARMVRKNSPVDLDRPAGKHIDFTIASDASDVGCGVSFINDHRHWNWGRRWTPTETNYPIHIREGIALIEALQLVAENGQHDPIRCLVDNTTLVGALRRRYSASHHLNEIVKRVYELMPAGSEVIWIPSAQNSADYASRNPDECRMGSYVDRPWIEASFQDSTPVVFEGARLRRAGAGG